MNLKLVSQILLFFLLLFFLVHDEYLIETINTNQKKLGKYDYFQKKFLQLVHKYRYLIKNNNKITDDCPSWIMYYKGIKNAPLIIKSFILSIENNTGNHPLYKLDKNNYNKYILLPKFLLDKFNNQIFIVSHFLEILKMGILSKFGGYWIDLTYFKNNPSISFYSSLFTFKLSKCNQKITNILMLNNFFVSSKNSFLTTYSFNAFLTYWKHYKYYKVFLLDYIIYFGYQNVNEFKKYIDNFPYIKCNFFSLYNKSLNESYPKRLIDYNTNKDNKANISYEYRNDGNKTNYFPISKISNEEEKKDFCIVGVWYAKNYGSMSTYYALYETIVKMGYTVMMIEDPLSPSNKSIFQNSHPYKLAKLFYNISSKKNLTELYELNKKCKGFIVGSDQLWNIGISRKFGSLHFLGFADNSTKKISYATSFGHPYTGTEEEKIITSSYLKRFNGISVRDKLSFDICQKIFGLKNIVQVCDPTFLCNISNYEILVKMAKIKERDPFILAYVLDPTKNIGSRLEKLSIDKDMKIIIILDNNPKKWEKNKENLHLSGKGQIEVKNSMNLYEWVWYLIIQKVYLQTVFMEPFSL